MVQQSLRRVRPEIGLRANWPTMSRTREQPRVFTSFLPMA
jgi:hypothetical protein